MDDAAPSTSLVCNFCSATSSAEGGPLLGCANCQVAAYCCSDHQTRDWSRHKVWCKVHSSRAHSARSSAESSLSAATAAASAASSGVPPSSSSTAAAAATLPATKRMESIRRIDSGHALDEQPSSSTGNIGGVKRMAMTTSSSGSSQTSGHSSGTDCSLASMGSTAAAAAAAVAAAAGNNDDDDPMAGLSTDQLLAMLQQQQAAAAAALSALPLPIDPTALLAATAANPEFLAQLTLMIAVQQQTTAASAAVAAASAAPPPQPQPQALPAMPQLFQPLGPLSQQLGLSGFSMPPPPPSAFPSVSTFDPANVANMLSALTAQAKQLQQQLPQQPQQQQPRFDLGAADPTPMMFVSSSSSSSVPPPRGSAPSTSAFAPPPARQSVVTSTFAQQQQLQQVQQLQQQGTFAPPPPLAAVSSSSFSRSAFSSTSSLHSAASSSSLRSVPTTVPNPFTYDTTPSSMQKIIDPKPSATVPAFLRTKAVAVRRGGKPAAVAAAAAAAANGEALQRLLLQQQLQQLQQQQQVRPSSSGSGGGAAASTSTTSSGGAEGAAQKRRSPDRPEGSRKRTTPSPKDIIKEERPWSYVNNDDIKNMPIDYADVMKQLQGPACTLAKVDKPPVVEDDDDDDDCQVIGEIINRRYRDHQQNLIYNFSVTEHVENMRSKNMIMTRHQATMLRIRYMSEHVIRSLNEFGWAVVDNFLNSENTKNCAKEMEKLYEKGLFTAGQLVDNSDDEDFHHERNEDDVKSVRSDYIFWYDGVDPRAEEAVSTRLLVSMLDALMCNFNGRIVDKEVGGRSRAMLAIYPGGSTRYVKHVDNPNYDGRLVTCIYYCNPGWDLKQHGGALRLFPETSDTPIDIDPQADRVVFFWSDRRNPHEVMPVHRHRFAVTIWYMEKNERRAAQDRKMKRKAAAAAALGIKVEDLPTNRAQLARMLAMVQPQYGELLKLGSIPQTHASTPHMANAAAAATANATALGLPPQAAAIGRSASPRSRSENNMARRFEVARSECTQDDVESGDEDIGDFIPTNTREAQPDYEI